MEPLFILFALVLVAGMVLGPIFGFVAWLTSRENRRRLTRKEELGDEVLALRRRVQELERRWESGTVAPREEAPAAETGVEARAARESTAERTVSWPEAEALATTPQALAPPHPSAGEIDTATPAADEAEGTVETIPPLPGLPEPGFAGEVPAEAHPVEAGDAAAAVPPAEAPPVAAPPDGPPRTAAPPPVAASPGSEPAGSGIDWERWIGLRGAAVLGGVVLALAALLFLKYSIEAGLIPPVVRVAISVFLGLGAIGGSQVLRKRGYETTANALAGAGVVILYGAVWAARVLYGFIGVGIAYLLMVLVTVVCGLLSWRYRSLVVAVLGLAGGFATPLLLSSGSSNPIGLFTYLLLLNLGILALARSRGWPLLAFLSVGVTGLYQAGWIVDRLRGDEGLLALLILGVFAVLFAIGTARLPFASEGREGGAGLPAWLGGGGAVGVAFVLTLHLSGSAQLGDKLLPMVALLALLSCAAQWMGHVHGVPWLALAVAGGDVAALLNWLRSNGWGEGQEWAAAAGGVALGLAFHLFLEWQRWRNGREGIAGATAWAAPVAAFGLLLVLVAPPLAALHPVVLPWVLAGVALAALLVRQSVVPGLEGTQALASLGLGIGAAALLASAGSQNPPVLLPWPALFLGAALALSAAFQVLGLRRAGPAAAWADRGAYLLPLCVLLGLLVTPSPAYRLPLVFLGGSLLLALLMVLAATRRRSGGMYAGTVALLALTHLSWGGGMYRLGPNGGQVFLALGLEALAVLLLTFWPVLAGRAFAGERWAWYAAALAGPAWFVSLGRLYEDAFGDGTIGLLPVVLGGLSLVAALQTRHLWSTAEPLRKSSLVWFAAVALGFVSLAVPLQLEKEWVTVAWALEGLATLALWKRLDHPGLKYFSLALLAAVSFRLVANPAVLGYHQASGVPLLNWLSYTYLIPAACLLGSAWVLHRQEVDRKRPWEEILYRKGIPVAAGTCGLAAILVVFAWINLSIVDFFSAGAELTLTFERAAARDLTTSLAWGIYAILLLTVGIARGWAALRWLSLAFLVLTIGKVFLYDLGELEDLYRVASLVGLAVSLILVSLVYQRFVFKRQPAEEEP